MPYFHSQVFVYKSNTSKYSSTFDFIYFHELCLSSLASLQKIKNHLFLENTTKESWFKASYPLQTSPYSTMPVKSSFTKHLTFIIPSLYLYCTPGLLQLPLNLSTLLICLAHSFLNHSFHIITSLAYLLALIINAAHTVYKINSKCLSLASRSFFGYNLSFQLHLSPPPQNNPDMAMANLENTFQFTPLLSTHPLFAFSSIHSSVIYSYVYNSLLSIHTSNQPSFIHP